VERKYILIIAIILLVVALVGGGFLLWTMRTGVPSIESSPSPTVISSPPASPVLLPSPTPTVPVEEEKSDLEQIKEAFAARYNKPIGDVTVTIDENTDTYANGGVNFAGEIGGGWWLAYHESTGWFIVADGNGSVICEDIEGYDFPVSMVPECWEEATSKLIKR